MSNELLWVLLLLINFFGIIAAYRLFGKIGLFVWIALASFLANIQVMKTIQLFGYVTTLGNIIYGTSFLATDILNENYSPKDARHGVYIGIFSMVTITVIMQICLYFKPDASDFSQQALTTIFSLLPRITLASLTAYFVSQLHDVWAYALLKRKSPKKLWLRNNLSTMVSQLIDNVIFHAIAFIGVFSFDVILQIFVLSYISKWLVALLDTPFIYIAKHMKEKGLVD